MTILVDDSIGSQDLYHKLPDSQLSDLIDAGGDVAFLGNGPNGTLPVGIEIKTITDAVDSWRSGRLVGGQLPKMSRSYKRIYLILEGYWRCGESGVIEVPKWVNGKNRTHSIDWRPLPHGPTYREFDNFLNTLSEIGHIDIKRSSDREETAKIVLDLYLWWAKEYNDHGSLMAFDRSREPIEFIKPSFKRRVAAELESIGWMKSEEISKTFPSVTAMANATPQEWTQIRGVGATLATKIWLEFHSLNSLPCNISVPKNRQKKLSSAPTVPV